MKPALAVAIVVIAVTGCGPHTCPPTAISGSVADRAARVHVDRLPRVTTLADDHVACTHDAGMPVDPPDDQAILVRGALLVWMVEEAHWLETYYVWVDGDIAVDGRVANLPRLRFARPGASHRSNEAESDDPFAIDIERAWQTSDRRTEFEGLITTAWDDALPICAWLSDGQLIVMKQPIVVPKRPS